MRPGPSDWPAPGQLQIFEAERNGSYSYPFKELLAMRHRYKYVGVRKLDPPLSSEQCAHVMDCVRDLWGRSYEKDQLEMMRAVAQDGNIKRTPKKQIASPVPMANTRLNIPMRLEVLRAKRALLGKKAIQVVPVRCVRRVSFAPQTTV